MKYQEIVNNKEINAYQKKGDANLGMLGFTDRIVHRFHIELKKY